MAYLFLVRHGESEWNKLGLWTGWTDVNLAPAGVEEARRAGELLKQYEIHSAHVSPLVRTQQTLQGIIDITGQKFPIQMDPALTERSYGVYTGKNKWQVNEEIGEEGFLNIRRGWDVHIPEGETLKMVHDRVVPYYEASILPELQAGKNVIVSSHGNTLRALMKHLQNVSIEDMPGVEIGTGEVVAYEVTSDGLVRLPPLS